MAGEPDVRVRLTPEGLSEVLAAFKKIQSEAVATKQKLATPAAGGGGGFLAGVTKGFGEFGTALAGVGKLLGPLGIAVSAGAAVVQLKNLVGQASETAEATQNLALSADVSIEGLQALQLVARDNRLSQEQLHGAIARTGQGLADLRDGVPEATKKFAELNLTASDFDGKDVAEALGLIAKAITALPGDQKLRALKEFFGDKKGLFGAFVDEIGTSSIDEVIEKYKKLGIILDGEVVKSAALVGNQFDKVNAQAQSMATVFLASAGPGIVSVLTEILDVVAENKDAIAEVGRIFGAVLAPAAALALIPIRAIATEIGLAVEAAAALVSFFKELGKATITGDQEGLDKAGKRLGDAVKGAVVGQGKVIEDAAKGLLDTFTKITKGPKDLQLPKDPDGREAAKANVAAVFRERAEFEKASADRELALLRAKNRIASQENQRSFDEGLRSLSTYFAERRSILEEESAAEIRNINQRIRLTRQDPSLTPGQRDRTVKDLESKRLLEQLDLIQKTEDLKKQELEQRRQLSKRILQVEIESTTDLKRIHQLKIAEINAESVEIEEAFRQLTGSSDVAARAGERFRNQKIGKLDFDDLLKEADSALSELSAKRESIQVDVSAGLLSQTQGEAQILQLEKDRLPTLEAISEQLLEIADRTRDPKTGIGNEEMIAQAEAFAAAIRDVDVAVQASEFSLKQLKAAAIDASRAGLVDVLVSTKDGFDDVGESALRAADQVVEALQRMAAEALATQLFTGVGGFLGSLFSGGFSGLGGNPTVPVLKAEGGIIRGPGTGTSDSIPAYLSDGEYVQPAATVRVPGVLQHLEALRQVRSVSDFRRTIGSIFTGGGEAAPAKYSGGFTITEEGRRVANDPAAYARSLVEPARETRGRRDRTSGVSKSVVARFADGGRVLGPGTGMGDSAPAATGRALPHLEALWRVRNESDFRRTVDVSRLGVARLADGGPVRGPGTGTSDSIPAWLSAGEYVQPAATVRVPGVLPHLEALRSVRSESDFRRTIATTYTRADVESAIRGMSARVPTSSSFIPRFAEGGLVSPSSFRDPARLTQPSAPASAPINGKLQIELGEGLEGRLLNGREFERAVMRIMHKNPRAIGSALGVRR